MTVVDIHLFLADQVRFEMMHRLEWIMNFEGERYSLMELVQEFDRIKTNCKAKPPQLSRSNADYAAYTQLTDGDKEVFIRQMLQAALDAFQRRL
jgi:hypothetical protein